MSDTFSLYEDNLNQVMDQLRKIIKTFTTLSKEKAESALTNATSLIKQGESLLRQMKLEISSNPSLSSLTSKVKNFNNEFDNLRFSFEKVQNSYISKKAENAIILGTDENTQKIEQKIELIENEDNTKESPKEEKVEIHNIFDSKEDKNDNMQSLPDENDLNIKIEQKNHKKMIIVIVIIIVVLIVGIGVLGVVLGKKNNKN